MSAITLTIDDPSDPKADTWASVTSYKHQQGVGVRQSVMYKVSTDFPGTVTLTNATTAESVTLTRDMTTTILLEEGKFHVEVDATGANVDNGDYYIYLVQNESTKELQIKIEVSLTGYICSYFNFPEDDYTSIASESFPADVSFAMSGNRYSAYATFEHLLVSTDEGVTWTYTNGQVSYPDDGEYSLLIKPTGVVYSTQFILEIQDNEGLVNVAYGEVWFVVAGESLLSSVGNGLAFFEETDKVDITLTYSQGGGTVRVVYWKPGMSQSASVYLASLLIDDIFDLLAYDAQKTKIAAGTIFSVDSNTWLLTAATWRGYDLMT